MTSLEETDTDDKIPVNREIKHLFFRKRIGLKVHFTRNKNSLDRIMITTMFGRSNPKLEGPFHTTKSTRDQLEASYHKLQIAYEKLSLLHERVLEINMADPADKFTISYQKENKEVKEDYNTIEMNYGSLKYKRT